MDIFIPPELTNQQKTLLEVNKIVSFNKEFLENMIVNHTTTFNLIWNNPNATPQEILDVFGTNSYKLFVVSSEIQQMIKKINPDYEPLIPPKPYVINEDGTVTVSD